MKIHNNGLAILVMNPRKNNMIAELKPLYTILDLNSRLFVNVLDGIDESQRHARTDANINHAAWLAGHVVSTRYFLGNILGGEKQEPYPELFRAGPEIQDDIEYPELATQTEHWQTATLQMQRAFEEATTEMLVGAPPFKLPVDDKTLLGALAFFVHHECYHLGQLGQLRKMLELPAMKYY